MPRSVPGTAPVLQPSFAELAFPIGSRFALRFDDDPAERSLMLQLAGWHEPESVLASGAPRIVLPPFAREGAAARARLREGSLVCTFPTRVLSVRALPHPLVQLAYPGTLHLSRVRDAMRVRTGIPALALVDGLEERLPCTIRDLSAKGLRVVAPGRLGENGAKVDLRFELDVDEATTLPVALGGHVRHATPATVNGHSAGWVHGVVVSAAPLASIEAIERYLRARRTGGSP